MTKLDPFLEMVRSAARSSPDFAKRKPAAALGHAERAHSKFSASGAERWFACPGSVELSEGLPDKTSIWAKEGTEAHEVLEQVLRVELSGNDGAEVAAFEDMVRAKPPEMIQHGLRAAKFLIDLHQSIPDSEFMVETRGYLDFIHPEMFGTFDSAIVDHFGTLHVFDYKYGAGVPVGPKENLQMIFYGIAVAHRFKWNFKRVRLWIIQPRIKSYQGPLYWDVSIARLKEYVELFRQAVARVEAEPDRFVEGSWCHWCKAKAICPLKAEVKFDKARAVFSLAPITKGADHGQEESDEVASSEEGDEEEDAFEKETDKTAEREAEDRKPVTEADWRKKAVSTKRRVRPRRGSHRPRGKGRSFGVSLE